MRVKLDVKGNNHSFSRHSTIEEGEEAYERSSIIFAVISYSKYNKWLKSCC